MTMEIIKGKTISTRTWALLVSGAIVVVLCAAGLVMWNTSKQHNDAVVTCRDSATQLSKQVKPVADLETARTVQAGQVSDPKIVAAFLAAEKKLKAASAEPLSCDASLKTSKLRENAEKMSRQAQTQQKAEKKVKATAGAVIASRDAKSLADAKAALQAKRDEGAKLLADSDGKVADNACRESLQQAVVDADKATTVVADVDKARLNVQVAIDAVNANIQAKAEADAQAAAVQAAPPARSWTQTQTPAPAPQYAQPRAQGQRNYQTPAAQAPAPAPATPAPQNNNNFDWNQWMENHKSGPVCVKGQACGIG